MALDPSSHLVLARKWRPERFAELVGQEHVTRTLSQALQSGRIAHAFLFTGIRGVGKTTAARILARCLNCAKGPTPEPCGECAACVEIREGRALDVVEIDGATYRKIDDARAIIENLSYRPARDRFKIYIIDEAHQLTDQAFNALLKTLEEPPAHVKFILATTEPQKMPETILSRLQRYDFRRIPLATTLARLNELAAREGVEIEESAIRLLAREAGGSMRDAERMLETAIAALGDKITESAIAASLGVAGRSTVFKLAQAILERDAAAALAAVREQHRAGANLEALGRDLLETLRNLAVAKLPTGGDLDPLADIADHEAAELRRMAERPSGRDLMRLFRLMADAQEQIVRSPYPDLLLEMAVVRMATLAPVMDADELLRALGAAGGAAGGIPPAAPPAASGGSGARAVSARAPEPTGAALPAGGARLLRVEGEVKADAPRRGASAATAAGIATPPGAARLAGSPPAAFSRPVAAPTGADLPELRDFIRARRAALAGFMEQGAALALDGDVLRVIPRNDIYIRYLSDNRGAIAELASELYGRKLRVEVSLDGEAGAAAAAAATAPVAEVAAGRASAGAATAVAADADGPPEIGGRARGEEALPSSAKVEAEAQPRPAPIDRQALYADPVVRRIFDEFHARLVDIRERPAAAAPAPGTTQSPDTQEAASASPGRASEE
ncbi:MAG TPA: DNA polymerase III subunit gamma/tau [Candidatus Binataceae bacterium]|nr:DNA polymerase III subunit gamma/tau [Candidatus Binataceae bacterium]